MSSIQADELKSKLLQLLTDVAPDVEPASVDANIDFREQFDFDSMDQLNFAIAIHKTFNIEIPESDYPKLASLSKCVAYVRGKQ